MSLHLKLLFFVSKLIQINVNIAIHRYNPLLQPQ